MKKIGDKFEKKNLNRYQTNNKKTRIKKNQITALIKQERLHKPILDGQFKQSQIDIKKK